MKANELRIGNYVSDRGGKVLRIDWWENINKVCMDMNINGSKVHPLTEHPEHCKPIPLTEEWLLKFGFKMLNKKCFYLNDIKVLINQLNKGDTGYGEFLFYKGQPIKPINEIHTLQNLHFALTNKELTLK